MLNKFLVILTHMMQSLLDNSKVTAVSELLEKQVGLSQKQSNKKPYVVQHHARDKLIAPTQRL